MRDNDECDRLSREKKKRNINKFTLFCKNNKKIVDINKEGLNY